MSTKLTNYVKDQITTRVLAAKFDAAYGAHDIKRVEFGLRLLKVACKGFVLSDAPTGFYPSSSTLKMYIGGCYHRIELGVSVLMPFCVHNDYLRFTSESPEGVEWTNLLQEKEVIDSARTDLKRELSAVLAACTTTKKLLELWPEAAEYLPSIAAPVPAIVDVTKLRKLIEA